MTTIPGSTSGAIDMGPLGDAKRVRKATWPHGHRVDAKVISVEANPKDPRTPVLTVCADGTEGFIMAFVTHEIEPKVDTEVTLEFTVAGERGWWRIIGLRGAGKQ